MAYVEINVTYFGEVSTLPIPKEWITETFIKAVIPAVQAELDKTRTSEMPMKATINWVTHIDGDSSYTTRADGQLPNDTVRITGHGDVNIDEMLSDVNAVLHSMLSRGAMVQEIRTLKRFKGLLLIAKDGADIYIPYSEYNNYCRYERKYGRLYHEEAEI